MKIVSNTFKENEKKFGRELDAEVTINNVVIGREDINSICPSFHSSLFKTIMQSLEIDSNISCNNNDIINAKIGIGFDNSDFEYINYNNYVVNSVETQEDTESYKIKAYDRIIESMVDYDLEITYPITIKNFVIAIFTKLGWPITGIPTTFTNSEKLINQDVYSGIGYTFRDILDEICTITGTFIVSIDNVPKMTTLNETNEVLDEETLSEDDVTFGNKYFINSLVFARSEESDNIYRKDDTSITQNGLSEFRISDNQLLSTNDRDLYIDDLFTYLETIDINIFDVKSTGVLYLDPCDLVTFNCHNNVYKIAILNDEITADQDIEEQMYMDPAEETQTDYKKSDTTDKRLSKAELEVDKQKKTITALASQVEESNEQVAQVVIQSDQINETVSNLNSDLNNNYMNKEQVQAMNDQNANEIDAIKTAVEKSTSSTQVQISIIAEELANGVTKVKTKTGYTFDEDGLNVSKDGEEMSNKISNEGVFIKRNNDDVTVINSDGMTSENATIRKFLKIGNNARMQDYKNTRTGVFYVGSD